jgi:hypothetical protein
MNDVWFFRKLERNVARGHRSGSPCVTRHERAHRRPVPEKLRHNVSVLSEGNLRLPLLAEAAPAICARTEPCSDLGTFNAAFKCGEEFVQARIDIFDVGVMEARKCSETKASASRFEASSQFDVASHHARRDWLSRGSRPEFEFV